MVLDGTPVASSRRDVVVGTFSALARLVSTGLLPPRYLDILQTSECQPDEPRLSDTASAAMLGVPAEVFELPADGGDPDAKGLRLRFLGRMSGRRLIHAHVVGGERTLEEVLAGHEALEGALQATSDPDRFAKTRSIMVLIFEGSIEADDLDKVREWGRKTLPDCTTARVDRVYVMGGRLRSNQQGIFVESRFVWPDAVAQLLLRFHLTPEFSVGPELIWIWRSIQFGPIFDRSRIVDSYSEELKRTLQDERTTSQLPELFREFTAVSGASPASSTDEPPISITWRKAIRETGALKREIDRAFVSIKSDGPEVTRDRERLRRDRFDRTEETNRRTDEFERKAWEKASENPAFLHAFWKSRPRSGGSLRSKIEQQRERWGRFLLKLSGVDARKANVDELKEVIESARNHFVSWGVRVSFAIAGLLAVLYVTFVMTKGIGGTDWYWTFLIVSAGAVVGCATAAIVSWSLEDHAGRLGCKRLEEVITDAVVPIREARLGASRLLTAGEVIGQEIHWQKAAQITARLGRRTHLVLDRALGTSSDADQLISPQDSQPQGALHRFDRSTYLESATIALCEVNDDQVKKAIEKELEDFPEDEWGRICRRWNDIFIHLDAYNRGYLPADELRVRWTAAISQERSSFIDRVVERLLSLHSRHVQLEGLAGAIRAQDGLSPAARPLLSSRLQAPEIDGDSVRFVASREADAADAVVEVLAQAGRTNVLREHDTRLPVYGLSFEEMPLERTSAESGGGS